jgi:hypothetical protein
MLTVSLYLSIYLSIYVCMYIPRTSQASLSLSLSPSLPPSLSLSPSLPLSLSLPPSLSLSPSLPPSLPLSPSLSLSLSLSLPPSLPLSLPPSLSARTSCQITRSEEVFQDQRTLFNKCEYSLNSQHFPLGQGHNNTPPLVIIVDPRTVGRATRTIEALRHVEGIDSTTLEIFFDGCGPVDGAWHRPLFFYFHINFLIFAGRWRVASG